MSKKKIRILFVYPNFASNIGGDQPVGAASLLAAMKRYEFSFDFFDTSFMLEDPFKKEEFTGHKIKTIGTSQQLPLDEVVSLFLSKFDMRAYDILLVSSNSATHGASMRFIQTYKQYNPEGFAIVGGVHPTVAPEETIREDGIDALCIGEGEEALIELLSLFEAGKPFESTRNFWFKKEGRIVKNSLRPYADLDTLTIPDYHYFEDRHFFRPLAGTIYRCVAVELSRGCPGRCSYCINDYLQTLYAGISKHHRRHSIAAAIKKLAYIKETYKANFFRFVDEAFSFMPKDYIDDFAREYKEKIKIPFWVQTTARDLDEHKVSLLKEMNCAALSIGVEHGNEDFRNKVLNKHVSNASIFKAMGLLKKYQIRSSPYFMIGLPFETRDLAFETIRMYKKLIDEYDASPASIQCFYPFQGTKLLEVCKQHKFLSNKVDIAQAVARPGLDMPQLSYDEIMRLKRTFFAYTTMDEKYYPIIKLCEDRNELSDKILSEIARIHAK